MKEYKKTMIATTIVSLLPILVGVMLWEQLPDQIATHFDMNGEPNGWSSKVATVFGFPIFMTIVQWFGVAVTLQDPKRKNVSEKLLRLMLWFIPVINWIMMILTYGYTLGYNTNQVTLGYGIMGIMFLVVGNYLPKCRQNYTMGIKIPWTLHDEENWNHTHRLAGYLWMAAGIVMITNIFLNQTWLLTMVMIVVVMVPVIYSYLYYRKHGSAND